MLQTIIFPSRYVQGPGCLKSMGQEASRLGTHALVLIDPFVKTNLLQQLQESLKEYVTSNFIQFAGESSQAEIKMILGHKKTETDLVIGVGGGKTIDTAKAVAYRGELPVLIAPTIASTDAPCSAVSVIYSPQGQFEEVLILRKNPDTVLVDTQIIAQAPVRFLLAGMGDALATYFEAETCYLGYKTNMTGNYSTLTAFSLARLCYETLLAKGLSAKQACIANVSTPALEQIVEANTLLSGIGFESGGLASAHAIHNGLTALKPTHNYLHGEKVTIGVLTGLILNNKSQTLINEVFSFCEEVGLPTTLAAIGLTDSTDAELMAVAKLACAHGESIHNEPFPVTPQQVFSALKAVDAIGKQRL